MRYSGRPSHERSSLCRTCRIYPTRDDRRFGVAELDGLVERSSCIVLMGNRGSYRAAGCTRMQGLPWHFVREYDVIKRDYCESRSGTHVGKLLFQPGRHRFPIVANTYSTGCFHGL
jgi:hypothetical protein